MIGHAIYLMNWAYYFSSKASTSEPKEKKIDKYFKHKLR